MMIPKRFIDATPGLARLTPALGAVGAAARIIPSPVGLALNAATVGSMIYDYF